MPHAELPLQRDMFTGEWVDARTDEQKAQDSFGSLPKQLDLFPVQPWLSILADDSAPSPCTALMHRPEQSVIPYTTSPSAERASSRPLLLPPFPTLLLLGAGQPVPESSPSAHPEQTPAYRPVTDELDEGVFTARLETLLWRIRRLMYQRWYGDFDAFELDNLIQAGVVYLWQAYRRDPATLNRAGDSYWCAIAKQGAIYEIAHEYHQRYRQQGSARQGKRTLIEIVVNADDLLAARVAAGERQELDAASLSSETCYSPDTPEIQEADQRLTIPRLEQRIFAGTHEVDHPLIRQILGYMRDGLTKQQMAEHAQVKVSTIRCAIRRMQQACGASQIAKKNRERHGTRLDDTIRRLRNKGLGGPEIARLIGTDWTFVYRRLHALHLMSPPETAER